MGNKLTEKQKKFCKEYIIDLNATQAAIRAGYSEKTARTILESDTGKDKFELIKEEVLEKANLLKNDFDSRKEYENVVKAGFDSIKFLTLEQRAKLINNILDLKTVNDLKAGINEVMELARIMESVEKRRNIVEKIEKQLKYSKNRKVGNKTVGKYDIATNKIFTKLRELNKLKQEEAREKLNEIDLDEESSLPFEDRVYNKFLYYKANGVRNTSTDLMQSLLEDVLTVKLVGRATKDEQQLQKKLNKQVKLNELLDILAEKPDKNSLKSGYIQGLANWESALNTIFNNNIKENYSLLLDESNTETWAWKEKQTFNEAAIKAYGVNSQAKLDDLIIDRLAEKYEFTEYVNERPNKKELNRMNIINIWIWNENTQLRQRLHNQYGVDQLKEMFSKLSIEDIKLALELMSTAEKFYKEANRIYIKKYGIELPRTQNYFPSRTERISEVDLLNDYVQASSSPSFIKSRVDSNQILMKEGNPVQTIYQHIDKMSRFINMTAKIDELNSIFKDPQMNRAISAKYGEGAYKSLIQMLANSSYAKQAEKFDAVSKIADKLINNYVVTKIALKPSIMLKQLLSMPNYASNMPVLDWGNGFLKAITNPKETIGFMMQSEYLKQRFASGGQTEFLKEAVKSSQFAKTKKFKDYFTLSVRIGDIGAIIFGGKPYIDYLMSKEGMSKEEAFEKFTQETLRSQQGSVASSLSNFQNNYNSPFMRGLFAFRNTSNQYARKVGDSIVSYSNGEISKTQLGKDLFIYTFLNSFFYKTASSLAILGLFATGDDEELRGDTIQSIFDFNSSAVPIVGDAWNYAWQKLTKGHGYRNDIPVLNELYDAIDKAAKKDVEFEDVIKAFSSLGEITTGIPLNTIGNMLGGTGDILQGDVDKGSLRTLGYSKYTAGKTTGKED